MEFYVASSLTGAVIGQLYPIDWEITDPLVGAANGSLTVRLPDDPMEVSVLRDLTIPQRRMIAITDGTGFVFCGPIPTKPRKPGPEAHTVIIPVVDWRSWFYAAYIRPQGRTRRNYIRHKTKKGDRRVEQINIMQTLARLALDTGGAPAITVDSGISSGIKRSITARQIDQSVGQYLDDVQARDRGCEWWTYATANNNRDPSRIYTHVGVTYPERHLSDEPVHLQWKIATATRPGGGTVTGYEVNDSELRFSRVWSSGDGNPPKQKWSYASSAGLRKGTDIAWEKVENTDAKSRADIYAYARKQIAAQPNRGTVDFDLTEDRLALSAIGPGDRARVDLDDGWNKVTAKAARITQRVMSGGVGKPTMQTLTVDLDDDCTPDDPNLVPGVKA